MDTKNISTGTHRYTDYGKPFKWGDRMVCFANEILSQDVNASTIGMRRVVIDIETGRELEGPFDVGTHVVHPEPGGAYHIHQVVDEDK
jgi:hypothetical protein